MKLRVIDPGKGIVTWELSQLAMLGKDRKKEEKERDILPPPLWLPQPENHDPEGRNER